MSLLSVTQIALAVNVHGSLLGADGLAWTSTPPRRGTIWSTWTQAVPPRSDAVAPTAAWPCGHVTRTVLAPVVESDVTAVARCAPSAADAPAARPSCKAPSPRTQAPRNAKDRRRDRWA